MVCGTPTGGSYGATEEERTGWVSKEGESMCGMWHSYWGELQGN